jgi:hypothetical protein
MVFPSRVDFTNDDARAVTLLIATCLTNNRKKSRIISKSTLELVDWMWALTLMFPNFQHPPTFFSTKQP